jgi:hypothetical protein
VLGLSRLLSWSLACSMSRRRNLSIRIEPTIGVVADVSADELAALAALDHLTLSLLLETGVIPL